MDDIKDPWEIVHMPRPSEDDGTTTYRMRVDGGWLYRVSTRHSNASRIVTACSESICPVMDPKPARK